MKKTVLITGCSTGLGRSAAKKFVAEGWNVIATMRRPDEGLAAEFADEMLVVALDVTDNGSIEKAIATGVSRFGRIDAVVNNAGVSVLSIFEGMAEETIRQIFETNVFGPMNVMRAIIPQFRAQGGGTIVNVSSAVGFAAVPLLSVYVASKHALEGLSESVDYELESQNIRVKLVEPGAVRTTNFAHNTLAVSNPAVVPETYASYFEPMLGAMMNYPFDDAVEADVVATIYAAACDETDRLRFLAGPDAEEMARLRWTTSEEEYLSTMRGLMGQVVWREAN